MRSRLISVVLVLLVLGCLVAASAEAQKGGPSAVLLGGQGVVAPDGKVRYVALTTGRQTIVSFVQVKGGQVFRWRQLPGYFGVPVVSLDGLTDGVSRDGRTLVLATPSGVSTQFVLIDTKTLKLRRINLRGSWSYDAISPDGSLLYLIQYTGAGSSLAYRVRTYDVDERQVLARPVVDQEIGERLMRGWSVTRKTSSDGRWAYTLYARQKHEPFVHALDTVGKRAFCIDLPLRLKQPRQMELRLALRADRMLEIRDGRQTVATVDTRSFVVHKH